MSSVDIFSLHPGPSLTRVFHIFCGTLLCLALSACSDKPQSAQLPNAPATAKTKLSTADHTETSRHTSSKPQHESITSKPDDKFVLPKLPPGWPAASMVAAANLDGTGDDEVLCWQEGRLSIWEEGEKTPYEMYLPPTPLEARLTGAPNKILVTDLNHDGRDEVLLAYGMTKTQRDAPINLVALRLQGKSGNHKRVATLLYHAESPRPQVVGLLLADLTGTSRPEILLAHYDSKYFVSSYILSLRKGHDPVSGILPARKSARIRMGTSWAAGKLPGKPKANIFVGRPYGEKKLDPGDIFLLSGRNRIPITSKLGVRSVAFGDGDGDRKPEVYFGDGWHYDYGKKARGRLSVARREPHGWVTHLIQQTPGQYEIAKIVISDVDQDGRPEIVTAGNRYIALFWHTPDGWMTRKLTWGDDFVLANLRGHTHLVIPGNPVRVVSLENPRKDGRPVSWSAQSTIPEPQHRNKTNASSYAQ